MPYNIKNETPAITRKMERCIAGISGTNPRTKKPYTESEKIAICKAVIMKQMKSKSDVKISAEEAADSLQEWMTKIQQALYDQTEDIPQPTASPVRAWLEDVYADVVIVNQDGKYWMIPWYVDDNDEVQFNFDDKIRVRRKITWEQTSEASTTWVPLFTPGGDIEHISIGKKVIS